MVLFYYRLMGKHKKEHRRQYRKKVKEAKKARKLAKQAEKKNICCCARSSCPDNSSSLVTTKNKTSTIAQSNSTIPNACDSAKTTPRSTSRSMPYLTDPLYVKMMEYNVLKKRVQQIESNK